VDHVDGLKNVNLEVPTGSLVFVTGDHRMGKATLLKLIADAKGPDQGTVFVPMHQKVIHIHQQPHFLIHLNLLHNLTFGCAVDAARISRIFEDFELHTHRGLEQTLMDNIRESDSFGNASPTSQIMLGKRSNHWMKTVSVSEARKLNLIRAFYFNPQVLILHKPVDHSDSGEEHFKLLRLLRRFVDERGVGFDGGVNFRRPRTVFFSGGNLSTRVNHNAKFSDIVWWLHKEGIHVELGDGKCPDLSESDTAKLQITDLYSYKGAEAEQPKSTITDEFREDQHEATNTEQFLEESRESAERSRSLQDVAVSEQPNSVPRECLQSPREIMVSNQSCPVLAERATSTREVSVSHRPDPFSSEKSRSASTDRMADNTDEMEMLRPNASGMHMRREEIKPTPRGSRVRTAAQMRNPQKGACWRKCALAPSMHYP